MKGDSIEVDLDVKLTENGTWPGLRKEKGVKVLEGAKRALGTVVGMRIDLGGGRVAIAEETLSTFLDCAGKLRAYYEAAMTSEVFANFKALAGMLQTPELKEAFETGVAEIERLRKLEEAFSLVQGPIPMLLWCPQCSERHIDFGEFATRPHHTHACQDCGMVWRPALVATVGVDYLPGFKNEEPPKDETDTIVTDAQLEKLGNLVERIDNLVHGGAIPMPDKLRVAALSEVLPDLHSELKTLYVEIAGDDP